MLTTLLFDVDGVLIHGDPFSKHLERDYGLTLDKTRPFFRGIFADCLTGKADLKQEIAAYLPQWGLTMSVDDFLNYWFTSECDLNAPLLETIRQFRHDNISCYLATNQEPYRATYLMDQLGLSQFFDGIFVSGVIGYMKDNPAFFEHVLLKLAPIPVQEILFWDDSELNVRVARAAGLQAEVYTDFADFQHKMQTYI